MSDEASSLVVFGHDGAGGVITLGLAPGAISSVVFDVLGCVGIGVYCTVEDSGCGCGIAYCTVAWAPDVVGNTY